MSESEVPVEAHAARSWKQTLREPKVWIPVAAGVAIFAIVGTAAAVASQSGPAASPSPSASVSVTPTATPSPSAVPSASPSTSPSASAEPSASPSPTASAEAYVPAFPLPGRDASTLVASFTSDDGGFWPIHFTRDSAYVAVAYDGMDPTRIYVGKVDGSQLTRLENVDSNYDATIGWSPDGRRLAFIAKTPDGPTLATVAPDGSGRKLLARLPGSAAERWVQAALSWSFDGESIAISFSEGRSEPHLITTMIVDSATGAAVTLAGASSATYSPTAGLLAYIRADAGDKCSLVLRDAKGSTKVLRTMDDCIAVEVSSGVHWAPDGSRLAYGEYRGIDQTPAWHVIAKDGSGDVKLTGGLWNSTVAWSPDSTRVAIGDTGSVGLTVYTAATGSGTKVVDLYKYPSGLAWASNNELIYTQSGYINAFRTDDKAWAGGGEFSESDAKYAVTPDGKRGIYVRSNLFDTRKATVEFFSR